MATSASGIQFTGLASGLDTKALIDAMLRADQSRLDALKTRQTAATNQVSAIGTLKSKFAALDAKLQALRFASQILTNKAVTDVTGPLTASADSTAVAGSFKVTISRLASATQRTGGAAISDQTISLSSPLSSAGLALTPTTGKFTVNGVQIDASAFTTLQQFLDAITNSAAGVTAEGYDATGAASTTNVVGIRLRNTNGSTTAITVGTAGDTSNFLRAVKLDVAVQSADRIQSTTTLGRLSTTAPLSSARLATPVSGSGDFSINGVAISWAATDSLQALISRINTSAANVTASYDQVADRLVLTSKATGAQSITVADGTGTLAAQLRLTNGAGATEAGGLNAQFSIDTVAGGAVQTSASNTVTGVVPGVTLNLAQVTATPVTVTVSSDATKPLAAAKEFVTAFNDVLDYLRANSKPDDKGNPGLFQGDLSVRMAMDQLRTMATSAVSGLSGPYKSLADLGITTGKVGSSVGTTNSLVLDEAKFTSALETNAQAAYDLMNNTAPGSEGVFTNLRNYVSKSTMPQGLIQVMSNAATTRGTDLTQEINRQQERLDRKRQLLQAQFARMESALAQIQAQGQRLQSQLGNLSQSTAVKPY